MKRIGKVLSEAVIYACLLLRLKEIIPFSQRFLPSSEVSTCSNVCYADEGCWRWLGSLMKASDKGCYSERNQNFCGFTDEANEADRRPNFAGFTDEGWFSVHMMKLRMTNDEDSYLCYGPLDQQPLLIGEGLRVSSCSLPVVKNQFGFVAIGDGATTRRACNGRTEDLCGLCVSLQRKTSI